MKYLITLAFFFLSFQDYESRIREIGLAMKAGSAKELIRFCNRNVEIKLADNNSNYSKNQAEVILRNFFSKNGAKDFRYIHQGSSPEGLKYNIGKLTCQNGTYRVVMFIKKIGDNYLIDTLNFTKE